MLLVYSKESLLHYFEYNFSDEKYVSIKVENYAISPHRTNILFRVDCNDIFFSKATNQYLFISVYLSPRIYL